MSPAHQLYALRVDLLGGAAARASSIRSSTSATTRACASPASRRATRRRPMKPGKPVTRVSSARRRRPRAHADGHLRCAQGGGPVLRGVELGGAPAKAPRPARPQGGDAAGGVAVPARAAGVPHAGRHLLVHIAVVVAPAPRAHLDRLHAPLGHRAHRVHHVGDLRLGHVDHRVVAQAGVGAQQQEQVGEAGDRGAQVRAAGCPARRRRAAGRRARGSAWPPGCP